MPDATFKDLVIDATDGPLLATFWSAALGLRSSPAGDSPTDALLDDGVPEHAIWVNQVPEPKAVKNRIHWDVWGETERFLDAGARLLTRGADVPDPGVGWDVLADPEGNEFCVFRPRPGV